MFLRSTLVACALFTVLVGRAPAQTPAPTPPAKAPAGKTAPTKTPPAKAPAATARTAPQPAADTGGFVVWGSVLDSVTSNPLVGARVQIVPYPVGSEPPRDAVTDSVGEFRLAHVPAGQYVVGFFHPALDSLGIEAPLRMIEVGKEPETVVDLAIPSAATLLGAYCPNRTPTDSTAVMLGYVRDADREVPLAGATVVALWSEIVVDERGLRQVRRQRTVKSGDDGSYKLCGIPPITGVMARAEHGADSSGFINFDVVASTLVKRDFGISTTDSIVTVASGDQPAVQVRRGRARLTGSVRAANGQPISGAVVTLWGSGIEAKTGQGGTFALSSLPSGTQSLEVRYVGYAPKRVTIDLTSRRPSSVNVVLDRTVATLAPVTVFGKEKSNRSLTGFLERKDRGFGRFVTREEIQKQGAIRTTDVLRRMPGVQVYPTNAFGYGVAMRGGCQPVVYVDGIRMMDGSQELDNFVQPSDIAGVEVYSGVGGAPPQYTGNSCGTILIWTGTTPP
jgi:hypothetical protein